MALENSMLVMNGKQVGGNTQDLTGYQTKVDNNLETESKEIAEAINELKSEKSDTDIVAADFNAGTSYTAGNYCIYDGKFYKFKASHSGAWSAADVDEIKIAGELASLKSGLNEVSSKLTSKYAEVSLDGVAITTHDSGGYWGLVVISNLPSGAIPYLVAPVQSFVGGVTYNLRLNTSTGEWCVYLTASESNTLSNITVRVYYF